LLLLLLLLLLLSPPAVAACSRALSHAAILRIYVISEIG
jgi:hypothetical protein